MKVLVTSPAFNQQSANMSKCRALLEKEAEEVVYNPYGRTLSKEEVSEIWEGADAIIAGVEVYDAEFLARAPKTLKVISRYGTGYEAIDVKAAGEQGILITNTPGVNAPAVADLTLGLMIGAARRMPAMDRKMREGEWKRHVGVGLSGKTLGILGLGAIGKEVALRAKGFSMNLLAYDPYIDKKFAIENNIQVCSLDEIFKQSDFITLHLPVTKDTERIINAENLAKMKPDAFLVNAARGKLVDEQALYQALVNGKLAGAGLDVFEQEPLAKSPLFELDNVAVLPHLGGHTQQAEELMAKLTIENTIAVLNNKHCANIVNQQYLK
ncbi:phosphoglycerate dehydrogenase [Petroclostridium sp. X23]|uniref:phosphoglycerate dehydrogenase n=1 Tax=Petroclostridium sp. X23 TaxID=3045146 RepID=UPI0024ACCB2D|nr:phosphoglycerate dehydrogenase [Petroclostridium sp. X23]WHH61016.1 phosphoglycerate dehydrogenase [Petroclostridium sp. X23]